MADNTRLHSRQSQERHSVARAGERPLDWPNVGVVFERDQARLRRGPGPGYQPDNRNDNRGGNANRCAQFCGGSIPALPHYSFSKLFRQARITSAAHQLSSQSGRGRSQVGHRRTDPSNRFCRGHPEHGPLRVPGSVDHLQRWPTEIQYEGQTAALVENGAFQSSSATI